MIILRRKQFAGYGDVLLDGVTYTSAKVGDKLARNVLDPIEQGLDYIEENPIVQKSAKLKKKVSRIKKSISPTSDLIERSSKKRLKRG